MMQFVFSQLDSWCFREARPMGALGGTAIESLFPPPASTLVGACRTLIGDSQQIDWRDFAVGKLPQMNALLGNGTHTGELRFDYPYLRIKQRGSWQRLFPVPAFLAKAQTKLLAMRLGAEPVYCDLGNVKLPEFAPGVVGAKPIENSWLTEEGVQKLLIGRLPGENHFISLEQLIQKENRLGIARDNANATVNKGALYQTEHIRLKISEEIEDIQLVVPVSGLPSNISHELQQKPWQVRLGGEGRLAYVVLEKASAGSNQNHNLTNSGMLYLTSPADLDDWLPNGFQPTEVNGIKQWHGSFNDVVVKIEAFCAGKPLKLGGWDSALRQPKPVKSLVPAGACYFVECEHPQKLIELIKQYRIGQQTSFGFGSCLFLPRIHA